MFIIYIPKYKYRSVIENVKVLNVFIEKEGGSEDGREWINN